MKQISNERLLLRIDEVAQLIGVSRTTAYALVNKRELPSVRIAGLLGLGCCRAKPIIAYKGEENRLPGSTGRAEVTVLLWISARPGHFRSKLLEPGDSSWFLLFLGEL